MKIVLCQDCKKREAQVHLTQIINNEKLSISLCKECAAARGFHSPLDNVPFPLAEILSGIAQASNAFHGKQTGTEDQLTCTGCGLTFEEFTRQGRFGCGKCYVSFRPRLDQIMRKIHGASLHRGKHPADQQHPMQPMPIREEERLESELRKAIENEDFERAAELRDKLRLFKEQSDVAAH